MQIKEADGYVYIENKLFKKLFQNVYITPYILSQNASESLLTRATTVKHTSSGSRAIYS